MIRILSGRYKGRNILPPPASANTRPFTGLAKKSVFDSLAAWVDDALVLDLYCGTGTAGLEAISRGARRCCFADRDRQVISRLQRNIQDLHCQNAATVWAGNIETRLGDWLAELEGKVDVAFVDPPYADAAKWDLPRQVEKIFEPLSRALAHDGRLVLRLPDSAQQPDRLGPLVQVKQKRFGNMQIGIWSPPEEPA
ncbi:MAG: RsmD family RNA methyltransferase [Phycisphaerae bacterium]